MASYHTKVKTFSRAQNKSSIAAAAYRAGVLIVDPTTGRRHDYRKRGGVVGSCCIAPPDAPSWAFKPSTLWVAAEAAERRKDSTLAREFVVALPHELTDQQRMDLALEMADRLVERYRFAVQASVHEPRKEEDSLNHHVHLLATTRRVGPEEMQEKTRELDSGTTGRTEVEWARAMVAQMTNEALERAGFGSRVDHRTLEAQANEALARGDIMAAAALTREPTVHMGKTATAMKRKGKRTVLGDVNAAIAAANAIEFDAAVAAYAQMGQAVATPEGHSQDRAMADRRRERSTVVGRPTAAPAESAVGYGEMGHALAALEGEGQDQAIADRRRERSAIASKQTPAAAEPNALAMSLSAPEGRRAAASAAYREAVALWQKELADIRDFVFVYTPRFMRLHTKRFQRYASRGTFAVDVRELLRRLKQLHRDAGRLVRRKRAEDQAETLLADARIELRAFDEANPRPNLPLRRAWSVRRAEKVAAVDSQEAQVAKASAAVGKEAVRGYADRTRASAQALDEWSGLMLERYHLSEDEPRSVFGETYDTSVPALTPPLPDDDNTTAGHRGLGVRF